jgi:hypothetical protein
MHCKLVDEVQKQYNALLWSGKKTLAVAASVSLTTIMGVWSVLSAGSPAVSMENVPSTEGRNQSVADFAARLSESTDGKCQQLNAVKEVVVGRAASAANKAIDKVQDITGKLNEKSAECASKVSDAASAVTDVITSPNRLENVKEKSRTVVSRIIWKIWPANKDHVGVEMSTRFPKRTIVGYACLGAALLCGGLYLYHQIVLKQFCKNVLTEDSFKALFEKVYCSEIADRDEGVMATWAKVFGKLKAKLAHIDLNRLPDVSKNEITKLRSIQDADIARLRLRAMKLVTDVPETVRHSGPMSHSGAVARANECSRNGSDSTAYSNAVENVDEEKSYRSSVDPGASTVSETNTYIIISDGNTDVAAAVPITVASPVEPHPADER